MKKIIMYLLIAVYTIASFTIGIFGFLWEFIYSEFHLGRKEYTSFLFKMKRWINKT